MLCTLGRQLTAAAASSGQLADMDVLTLESRYCLEIFIGSSSLDKVLTIPIAGICGQADALEQT